MEGKKFLLVDRESDEPKMAETMAARAAVRFAQELSCSAMEIQGDVVVIINALHATDAAALSGEFGHILNDARHILKSFSQRKVTFGRQETNKVAHSLTDWSDWLISSLHILASFFILLVPLFASRSLAADNSSTPVSTGTICKSTPDPSFCKSVLPSNNTAENVYYYGRFSVRKSLSQSRKFLNLVDKYLKRSSTLSLTAVRALEDCLLLAGLNMDFLLNSFETVNNTSNTLPALKADDVQTLLSAILTNQQTCFDGIQSAASAWSLKNGLSIPLKNDTKFYSVSLALFTKGWVPKKKKQAAWRPTRMQRGFKNGRLPLKMSSKTRAVYESVSKRKMLQTEAADDQVLVSDIVTVSQDGTGNYSTINDAIAAAPNNSAPTDGYFLIYVTAGVYEEYVSVAKNKRYLMMVGDGINQTIITGNRSVVDGWTTFNSATLVTL
ncbi:hypothetical protein DVH24_027265 [Malus domestica]|uniref:pectinesterase n=1 Tax=Malus domestica TaxID=3750 RepID=A0A498ILZ5_MALDO|nr:hypothetical protein DVH24_027265 [Malus domestica]